MRIHTGVSALSKTSPDPVENFCSAIQWTRLRPNSHNRLAAKSGRRPAREKDMTCSSLRVEVQDPYILVDMRGPVSGRNFANKKHLGLPWMRMRGCLCWSRVSCSPSARYARLVTQGGGCPV